MVHEPLGGGLCGRSLGAVYGGIVGVRNWLFDHVDGMSRDAGIPVVSVGGIRAGGTGKTPLALRIGELFAAAGREVAFVSRGYGRANRTPVIVPPQEAFDWRVVGDEPALLRRRLPQAWLVVDHKRVRGLASLLRQTRSQPRLVAVLDDGFQHRWVRRRLDVVALSVGIRHEKMIPEGYLRESLHSLRRAHVMCLIGAEEELEHLRADADMLRKQHAAARVYVLTQRPGEWVNLATGEQCVHLPLERPALMTGIARPERFERFVTATGRDVVRVVRYRDHHPFTTAEIATAIQSPADGIATTEKDALRLSTLKLADQAAIWYLRLRLVFDEPSAEEQFSRVIAEGTLC
jgi:tetraacyldisaccharide 4'-kinase